MSSEPPTETTPLTTTSSSSVSGPDFRHVKTKSLFRRVLFVGESMAILALYWMLLRWHHVEQQPLWQLRTSLLLVFGLVYLWDYCFGDGTSHLYGPNPMPADRLFCRIDMETLEIGGG